MVFYTLDSNPTVGTFDKPVSFAAYAISDIDGSAIKIDDYNNVTSVQIPFSGEGQLLLYGKFDNVSISMNISEDRIISFGAFNINLTNINLVGSSVSSIVIGWCNNLESVSCGYYVTSITVEDCPNLTSLNANNCSMLEYLAIKDCNILNNINLSGCDNIYNIDF